MPTQAALVKVMGVAEDEEAPVVLVVVGVAVAVAVAVEGEVEVVVTAEGVSTTTTTITRGREEAEGEAVVRHEREGRHGLLRRFLVAEQQLVEVHQEQQPVHLRM